MESCLRSASAWHDPLESRTIKSKEVNEGWVETVWYISHLIASYPHSVTTPERLVWNSSQKFRGLSLNDLLLKGPDMLRAVLLRFRAGVFAALGDIRKMYNSVWLEDQNINLYRFLCHHSGEEEIDEYVITRVHIGANQYGLCSCQRSQTYPYSITLRKSNMCCKKMLVDNILTSHNSMDTLKVMTSNVKTDGFHIKPWFYSDQSGREESRDKEKTEPKTMILPNLHDRR